MKNITIAGRLSHEPELRYAQSGTAVLRLQIPVDDGYGDKKTTMWFNVSFFGKKAEGLKKVLVKSMGVAVSGDFRLRTWDKDNGSKGFGLDVNGNELTVTHWPPKKEENEPPLTDPSQDNTGDDDIPF